MMVHLLWPLFSLTAAGASFVQPLKVQFGDSCEAIYSHYEVEKVHAKNNVETHVLQNPEVAFPNASRVVMGCEAGIFQNLVIIAETDEKLNRSSIISKLEAQFESRYECPQNEDEAIFCAIFQKERIVAIYNGDLSEIGEYSLVYAYKKDAGDIGDALKSLRSGG